MNKLYEEDNIQMIADAIREKKGYSGKNLFKLIPYTDRGITFEEDNDGTIKISGTASTTYCSIPSNKRTNCNLEIGTYTYSRSEITQANIGITLFYEDNTAENKAITGSNTSITFTTTKKIVQYGAYLSGLTSGESYEFNIVIQLEEGSTATKYEPYSKYKVADMPQAILDIEGGYTILDVTNKDTILIEDSTLVIEEDDFKANYQEVEYIESTGTQYIDTGYMQSLNDDFYFYNVKCPRISRTDLQAIFSAGTGTYQTILLVTNISVSEAKAYFKNANSGIAYQVQSTLEDFTNIKIKNDILYYNNINVGSNVYEGQPNTSLYLFKRASNQSYCSATMGKVIVMNNNEIKMYLIPCYRKIDGVIGMYDKVSKQFFTNQGTGTFLKGADI